MKFAILIFCWAGSLLAIPVTPKEEITYHQVEGKLGKTVAEMWQRMKDNGATPEEQEHFLKKENDGLARLFTKISSKFGEEVAKQYIRMKDGGATDQELGVYLASLAQSVRRPEGRNPERITMKKEITYQRVEEELGKTVAEMWQRKKDNGATPEQLDHFLEKENRGLTRLFTKISNKFGEEVAEQYIRMKGSGVTEQALGDYLAAVAQSVRRPEGRNPERIPTKEETTYHQVEEELGKTVAEMWQRMKDKGATNEELNEFPIKIRDQLYVRISNEFGDEVAKEFFKRMKAGAPEEDLRRYLESVSQSNGNANEERVPAPQSLQDIERNFGKVVLDKYLSMKNRGKSPKQLAAFLREVQQVDEEVFNGIAGELGLEVAEDILRMKKDGVLEEELIGYMESREDPNAPPLPTFEDVERRLGKSVAKMYRIMKNEGKSPKVLMDFLRKAQKENEVVFAKIAAEYGERVAKDIIQMKMDGASKEELKNALESLAHLPQQGYHPLKRHRTVAEELTYHEIGRVYGEEVANEYFRLKDFGISQERADDYLKKVKQSALNDLRNSKPAVADQLLYSEIKMTYGKEVAKEWWRMKSSGIREDLVDDFLETFRRLERSDQAQAIRRPLFRMLVEAFGSIVAEEYLRVKEAGASRKELDDFLDGAMENRPEPYKRTPKRLIFEILYKSIGYQAAVEYFRMKDGGASRKELITFMEKKLDEKKSGENDEGSTPRTISEPSKSRSDFTKREMHEWMLKRFGKEVTGHIVNIYGAMKAILRQIMTHRAELGSRLEAEEEK